MTDRKNSFGRGKNETNIVCIQSQVRGFPVPFSDTAHAGSARSFRAGKRTGAAPQKDPISERACRFIQRRDRSERLDDGNPAYWSSTERKQ
jgi:hypothetical protein